MTKSKTNARGVNIKMGVHNTWYSLNFTVSTYTSGPPSAHQRIAGVSSNGVFAGGTVMAHYFKLMALSALEFLMFLFHRLQNHENEQCFSCRVVHIPDQLLSGVQVFFYDKLMATSYVIGSSQLPIPMQVGRRHTHARKKSNGVAITLKKLRTSKGDY